MFKFSDLQHIHLEITNNCQASCPMCNRNINGGIENPLIKINNWSLEEFKQIISPEVLNQIQGYHFCGNFGDPILNNDLIEMCKYSKDTALNVYIHIFTNGGARNAAWWKKLASSLPSNHLVVFALDGLDDTHHLYRIGTTFDRVIENAKTFINSGGNAEWAFIVFKHNEHQVDEARNLAKKLGFKRFAVKNSSRFVLEPKVKVLDKHGTITHYIEPSSDTVIKFIDRKTVESYKKIVNNSVIDCKVLKTKEVFIDAHKNFFPCCWLASVSYTYINNDEVLAIRKKMLEQHHIYLKLLGNTNTLERPIKDIINSEAYQQMWKKLWGEEKMISCVRSCGVSNQINFSQPHEQFIENHNLNE